MMRGSTTLKTAVTSRSRPPPRRARARGPRRAVLNPYAGLEGTLKIPLQRLLNGAFLYGRQEGYAEAVDVEADRRGSQVRDLAGAVWPELKENGVEVRHLLPQVVCGGRRRRPWRRAAPFRVRPRPPPA